MTVLVSAHTEVTIPVSCVEQGRWGYRGRQFRPSDASLYASVRAQKAAHVNRSVRTGRGHQADQGAVWAHLASRASQLRVDSDTGAMRDVYARHQTDMTAAMKAKDAGTLSTLRMLKTALMEAKTKKPKDAVLTADEEIDVLQRYAKKRRETIDEMKKLGRDDHIEHER